MARGPQVGDEAPDFELTARMGASGSPTTAAPGRAALLPGDETPVCTKQFCSYRDRAGTWSSSRPWSSDLEPGRRIPRLVPRAPQPDVPLLADTDRAVAKRYGMSAPVLGTRRG